MISKKEHEKYFDVETIRYKYGCFACKKPHVDEDKILYGIVCNQYSSDRVFESNYVWFCEPCWLGIAGEEWTFWDFSKNKL